MVQEPRHAIHKYAPPQPPPLLPAPNTPCTTKAVRLLQKDLDSWELEQLLSGKYDACGCRLTINAGAGGVDAMDWALMLQRMYLRYFERRRFKYTIVEEEVRCKFSSFGGVLRPVLAR